MDSGDEIFLTQNSFKENDSEYDTDSAINDILSLGNINPNFDLECNLFDSFNDDKDLLSATLEIEKNETSEGSVNPRFSAPLSEVEINDLVKRAVPKNTVRKSSWAFNLFTKWMRERNLNEDVIKMSNERLNELLGRFVTEVKTKNGEQFRPNTLYEIIVSIQHFLRQNGNYVSLLEGGTFSKLRQILDAKMKEIAKSGVGSTKKQANIISKDQEEEMWKRGVLGTNTPAKLIDTLVYSFGLNFALRAGQEHRNLRFGPRSQISVQITNDGMRYLEYREDVSKSNNGGINCRKIQPKITRAYEDLANPDRCIVKMYEKYIQLRPQTGKSTAFYLRPKKYPTPVGWFDDVPVGIHTLQQTVGKLCKSCGFEGFYTNHSLRATAATRLYAAGVDEQLISEKTGHRSVAIRGYKRTSEEQLRMVDDIVKSKKQKVPSEDEKSGKWESMRNPGLLGMKINVEAKQNSVSINVNF